MREPILAAWLRGVIMVLGLMLAVTFAAQAHEEGRDEAIAPKAETESTDVDDDAEVKAQAVCTGRICCIGPVCWVRPCPPCPPCPASETVTHTTHNHYPCRDHTHTYSWESNQRQSDCKCFCNKRTSTTCINYI